MATVKHSIIHIHSKINFNEPREFKCNTVMSSYKKKTSHLRSDVTEQYVDVWLKINIYIHVYICTSSAS